MTIGKFGRIRDTNDHRDLILDLPLFLTSALPPSAEVFTPGISLPVYDQGDEGSCTANAGILFRRWLAQRYPKFSAPDQDLSRQAFYQEELILEGTPGQDNGAQIRDIFVCLTATGAPLESAWPYSTPLSSIPGAAVLAAGASYKIGAYHRIVDLPTAKSVLALGDGYPFVIGFTVYDSFQSIGADGVMPMPSPGEQILGGHAVLCHGYDDSKGALLIQNSWGPDWGAKGQFWMPYSFYESDMAQIDSFVGHLGPAWS